MFLFSTEFWNKIIFCLWEVVKYQQKHLNCRVSTTNQLIIELTNVELYNTLNFLADWIFHQIA